MMKRCVKCEGKTLAKGPQEASIDVGRRTFDGEVQGSRCSECGEVYYDGRDLVRFEELVAGWIASHGYDTGEDVRFLRRSLGIRAAELAELLDVTPETVSHWETGKTLPDARARNTLAALVLDKIAGKTDTRDRLAALRAPSGTRKQHINLRPHRAA